MKCCAEPALPMPTFRDREYEAIVEPIRHCLQPLLKLASAVRLQGLQARRREDERPPALRRLQRLERELFADDLELLADAHFAGLEVDVVPAKTRGFAEAQ